MTDAHAPASQNLIHVSSAKFVIGCALAALAVTILWRFANIHIPSWVLAAEVFLTIIALFVFGSIRIRIHKNAITYGMVMVIIATFLGIWWKSEHADEMRQLIEEKGALEAWTEVLHENLLTFHGLDRLVHLDTMLFILGLTYFVAVISQTRLLETITFALLRRYRGYIVPTVLTVLGVVSFCSGILDGVSMIGLTIRTLIIILALASAPTPAMRRAIIICTAVTTVCGMWLAYGEPPNLIMKANVTLPDGRTRLDDAYFLTYCLPAAVLSFLVVAWTVRNDLKGGHIALEKMDILDANVATVRFLQAQRHGEVWSEIEFIEEHKAQLGPHFQGVLNRRRNGEPMGLAMVREGVPADLRRALLGKFVCEEVADKLDRHYELLAANQSPGQDEGETAVRQALDELRHRRLVAARIGAIAIIPFVGFLVAHALHHEIPLFLASFAGFGVAITGIYTIPAMRKLALREAWHEYTEYLFLFPLFLSISLLSEVGFFNQLKHLLELGIQHAGAALVAWGQLAFCTVLSAMLDNNVVADFGGKAIRDLGEDAVIKLFAMAQIAGYATGGCLTHIGSAQSVVAYAFLLHNIDNQYTPAQWIKDMFGVGMKIFIALSIYVFVAAFIHHIS